MFEGPCGSKSLDESELEGGAAWLDQEIRVQEEGRCQAMQGPAGQGRDSVRSRGIKAGQDFAFLKHPCGYHVEEARRHK